MLNSIIKNNSLEAFPIYAGVLSIKKNQRAKDGRIFHVLILSDGEDQAKLYLWSNICKFMPNDFIRFTADIVVGKSSFFSCKDTQVERVEFSQIPKENPARGVQFRYYTDLKDFSNKVRLFSDSHVKNEAFLRLIYQLTEDSFLERISTAPAGRSAHHSLEGGLMKHVSEMFELYKAIADTSVCEKLRHEFVVIGIILHDYFKFSEYTEKEGEWQLTEQGVLLGHIFQGARFLHNFFIKYDIEKKISDLDRQKAVHVLLAHHGQQDWGSPVVPAIPEASVLHYIDQISAKLNMFSTANSMEFNKFLGTIPVI